MASEPSGRFAMYRKRLAAISVRTGAPLPSLFLSFGILHEITAVAPLVCFFYGARVSGIGERLVSAVIEDDKLNNSSNSEAPRQLDYAKQKMKTWVQEGDRWAIRVGRRYGIFGYEKREAGTKDNVEEMSKDSRHLAGDVANAVLAYSLTKVCNIYNIVLYFYFVFRHSSRSELAYQYIYLLCSPGQLLNQSERFSCRHSGLGDYSLHVGIA